MASLLSVSAQQPAPVPRKQKVQEKQQGRQLGETGRPGHRPGWHVFQHVCGRCVHHRLVRCKIEGSDHSV